MGEASYRKATDPNYGKPKPSMRGLIVSPPTVLDGNTIRMRSSNLDPQELRFSLLFWDRLAWPKNNVIYIESTGDALYLEGVGVLSRPAYSVSSGTGVDIMLSSFIHAFDQLNAREPGMWALSQGENSLLVKGGVLVAGRGALVELHRAIPVPTTDVPLAEILEFRAKRKDELFALRHKIESLYSHLENSRDKEFELTRLVEEIDRACSDVFRLEKERGFSVRFADLKSSFDFDIGKLAKWAIVGESLGLQLELPIIGAALGGIASTIKLGTDFGVSRKNFKGNAYRYVHHMHDELR